ncbi:MAG: hypothetical protein ABIE74_04895, partial [Pseudomonadota bacterium]
MSNRLNSILMTLALFLTPVISFAGVYPVCGKFEIDSPRPIRFTSLERELACGESKLEAWKKIPTDQSQFLFTSFLQERGYYFPTFRKDGEKITIVAGERSKITKLIIEGDMPEDFKVKRQRKIIGEVLTPPRLNVIEKRISSWLSSHGYPCPTVKASAQAASGMVTIHVDTDELVKLDSIEEAPLDDLKKGVLRRYDSFKLGKTYNNDLLTLTTRRIEKDGILSSSYFVTDCLKDCTNVEQRSIAGKPRLFIFGVGVSTEEYGIGKASWKHARLGKNGSSIEFSTYASYRLQRFASMAKLYLLPKPSRWFLAPLVTFQRENEKQYDLIRLDAMLAPSMTWDGEVIGVQLGFGPNLNFTHTFQGDNKGSTKALSVVGGIKVTSHDFEFYDAEPRSGFNINFTTALENRNLLSSITAQSINLNGEVLFNVADFNPPFLVLGFKYGAATTIVKKGTYSYQHLPPTYQKYLGGSD